MSLSVWIVMTCDAAGEILRQTLANPALSIVGVVVRQSVKVPDALRFVFHVGDPWEEALLSTPNIDVLLCAGYPNKISSSILAHCRLGGFNCHPSLLPSYRGRMPGPQIVKDQFPWAGVTVHKITEIIDGGPVVTQIRVAMRKPYSLEELKRVEGVITVSALTTLINVLLSEKALAEIPQDQGWGWA